jgi:hypothetical protein
MQESNEGEAKQLSRMELEAMAQVAMRDGLSKEQVAYEQWVDTQPIEDVVAWDEMGEEARKNWVVEHLSENLERVSEVQANVEQGGKACFSTGMLFFDRFATIFTFLLGYSNQSFLL